jgi:hypothetical protein
MRHAVRAVVDLDAARTDGGHGVLSPESVVGARPVALDRNAAVDTRHPSARGATEE